MFSGFLKSSADDFRPKTLKRRGRILRGKRNTHVLPPGPLTMVIYLVKSSPTSHKTISGGSLPPFHHLPSSCLVERQPKPWHFLGKIPNCRRILSTEQRHLRGQKCHGVPGQGATASVPAACGSAWHQGSASCKIPAWHTVPCLLEG